MYEETLLHRFAQAFIKAVKGEMESMKRRLGSFELPVTLAAREEETYRFTLNAPTDKISRAMQCSLRADGSEYAVEVADLDGLSCYLNASRPLPLALESRASLVVYPWFLYEKLIAAMESLSEETNTQGIDLAFKAFGRLPVRVARREPAAGGGENLNQSQKEAVAYSLGSDVSFVWGPPGTGKTHTLARLLEELLGRGKRILVASTTNGAVDTVIEKMAGLGLAADHRDRGEVVRLGRPHPTRREVNVDTLLGRINGDPLEKRKTLLDERERLLGERAKWEELLKIIGEADDQMGLFGNAGESVRRIELDQRLEEIRESLEKIKADMIRDPKAAVARSRLLFSTLASLYTGRMLEGELFDAVVVEEAGMAVLPALFYSLTRAREQVVLVGDPMQLPPVVQSDDAYVKRAMGRSIYAVGLEDDFSDEAVHLLDTQYRMHPEIGDLIGRLFYQGRLMNGIAPGTPAFEERAALAGLEPAPGRPFCRIDLKGRSACSRRDGSSSRFNEESARVCLRLVRAFPDQVTVALIAPYADQARLMGDLIREEWGREPLDTGRIQCSTVHRFQGQERDVVILDLTDAPPLAPGILVTGEFGGNLLNVALSRARGKLIVIGEREYFLQNAPGSAVADLLEYGLGRKGAGR